MLGLPRRSATLRDGRIACTLLTIRALSLTGKHGPVTDPEHERRAANNSRGALRHQHALSHHTHEPSRHIQRKRLPNKPTLDANDRRICRPLGYADVVDGVLQISCVRPWWSAYSRFGWSGVRLVLSTGVSCGAGGSWPEDVSEADEFDDVSDLAGEVGIDPQLPPVVGGVVEVDDEQL